MGKKFYRKVAKHAKKIFELLNSSLKFLQPSDPCAFAVHVF